MSETLRPLIERAQAGDRDALNELARCVDRFVRIFSGRLGRHLRRTTGSTIDFVLEGLAEALARLPEFEYRSDEQFYAWTSRYIRNRIVDAARYENRDRRAGRPVPLGSRLDEPAGRDPTASQVLSELEFREAIGTAIVQLQLEHPDEMEAVILKLFEGLSWSGLRARLALSSEKRGRTLFARGVDLLRPRLDEALGTSVLAEYLGLSRHRHE